MSKRAIADFFPEPGLLGLVCAVGMTVAVAQMQLLEGAAGRLFAAALVLLLYGVFCFVVFVGHRRKQQALARWGGGNAGVETGAVVVAFASQTGFAEQLALQTAQSLQAAGMAVRLCELGRLDLAQLQLAQRILFLVSTTGEGDAPDSAAGFARKVMGRAGRFEGLRYGVLALGDRSYGHYCAFGHALATWLHRHGAQALFDTVEVDAGDNGALRHWQHHLGVLSGQAGMADWSAPAYERWRLAQRGLLNPGSAGAPAFHLVLTPADARQGLSWQAGDIVEIGPRNAPAKVAALLQALQMDGWQAVRDETRQTSLGELLSRRLLPDDLQALTASHALTPQMLVEQLRPLPHREYSIASLPQDGRLELLVRQTVLSDGSLGLGSGWLTTHLGEGGELDLRVRENRSFHPPASDIPLILIGNGTGLAGLRAHMKARIAAGRHRNWLLFGERSEQHDFFFREEVGRWRSQGVLQRLDLAFSRDQAARVYVQDKLREAGHELQRWVGDGAAIYVCGSLEGMAAGVAQVLHETLGEETLEAMAASGRYRRDVY